MAIQKYIQPIFLLCLFFAVPSVHANSKPFDRWLSEFRTEAKQSGVTEATLNASLDGLMPNDEVIRLDRKQPEKTQGFDQYMRGVLPQSRIDRAVEEMSLNWDALQSVEKRYGVQPEYVVALWGMESSFGERMGNFSVVESLATLAYDGRRSKYFRGELLKALSIIDAGHISFEDMIGSWAGAMGQCQFMPSSFLNYAVDANGDGRKDIWYSREDVFASIANYLSSVGWDGSAGVGSRVSIEQRAYRKHREKKMTVQEWSRLGVIPEHNLAEHAVYSLVSGNQDGRGPYYLVSENYHHLLKWNRSRYFALAVGSLADAISQGEK